MMTLVYELTADQKLMVEAIYSSYLNEGKWPEWRYVKRWFRQRSDSDPKKVRDSFPVVGTRTGFGPSYSIIRYNRSDHSDGGEYRLYLAAGLHLQEFAHTAEALVEVIRYLANGMKNVDPNSEDITISRNQLAKAMHWDTAGMRKIPDFLHAEPLALITSSHVPDDDNWTITLGDDGLVPYFGVNSLQEYVEKTTKLITEISNEYNRHLLPGASGIVTTPVSAVATTPAEPKYSNYVSADLIAKLEMLKSSNWHLGKLVAMLHELNAAYAAEHQYSSVMLCRAIMDHVPPVFGCATFNAVTSQVSMTQTDKKHLKLLGDNRFVSDDALHRHISKHADVVEMQDVPQRLGINTLVRLVIDSIS